MKIGIDFDDVIVDTLSEWCRLANNYQKDVVGVCVKEWSPTDVTSWGLNKITGLGEDTISELFKQIDYKDVRTIPSAYDGILCLLDDGHEVHILSENRQEQKIREWLDHRFPDLPLFAGIEDKAWYAWVNNFDVLIDDKPETLEKAVGYGLYAIRFERPWNKKVTPSLRLMHTAYNWGGLLSVIRTISRIIDPYPFYGSPGYQKRNQMTNEADFFGECVGEKTDQKTRAFAAYEEMMKQYLEPKYYYKIDGDDEILSEGEEGGEPLYVSARGGKQTDIEARFDLLPMKALQMIARVLNEGEKKYGVENWKKLEVAEINNHTMAHLIEYFENRNIEDLSHAACRALMALELAIEELEDWEFELEELE